MLNVKVIKVSKMTSHCMGTVRMREESDSGLTAWQQETLCSVFIRRPENVLK